MLLSLFYGSTLEEVRSIPYLDYSRFESSESHERKQEVDYVMKNRKKINQLLKKYNLLPYQWPIDKAKFHIDQPKQKLQTMQAIRAGNRNEKVLAGFCLLRRD